MHADFLFELYTEEIPASYQESLIDQWEKSIRNVLKNEGLQFESLETGGTPRRLFVFISGLQDSQPVREAELKGPPKSACFTTDGNATPALEGFAARAGIDWQKVEFREFGKAEYAYALSKTGGKKSTEILAIEIARLMEVAKTPRKMRWGSNTFEYARPVLSYTAMYGNKTICFPELDSFGTISCSSTIRGHLIYGPRSISLSSPLEYFTALRDLGIPVRHAERREEIRSALLAKADSLGLAAQIEESLLSEVTFLVERPSVVDASFDPAFLEMPEAVAISEMQQHQRYFPMREKSGKLSNRFLIVSNSDTQNGETEKNVRQGNQRVLRARLEDGSFFFREDRKCSLFSRVEDLRSIVYMDGYGTMYDKAERLGTLAQYLRELAKLTVDQQKLERASWLCKADLTTALVYEFDHLQGEIGSEYARLDKEDDSIAAAIAGHYLPRFQGDSIPADSISRLISIADKMDNIVAGFLSGKQPTSSQDPLALRRQALYTIEIIVHSEWRFSFRQALAKALSLLPGGTDPKWIDEIYDFMLGRMATIFEKSGISKKMIRAGIANASDDITVLYKKLMSLSGLSSRDPAMFEELIGGFTRMVNIIADTSGETAVKAEAFLHPSENRLYEFSARLQSLVESSRASAEYDEVFSELASAKSDVDAFFDNVMVMHEDLFIRQNRLALLRAVVEPVRSIIELSELK